MTNSSNATATASASFPVFGLATAVLFVLKVAGINGASWGLANISWWLVFAPMLVAFGLVVLVLVIFVVVAVLIAIFD